MLFRSRAETRRIALQLAVLCGLVGSIVWRQQDYDVSNRLRRDDELHTTTPTAPISPAPHLSYSEPSVAIAAAPATIAVDVAGGAQLLATVKARGESERRTRWPSVESEESVTVDHVKAVLARAVNVGRGGTGVRSRAATTPSDAELARVACVHEHLGKAFGWHERGPLFYLRGCNREAMVRAQ